MGRIIYYVVFILVFSISLAGLKGLDHFIAKQVIVRDAQILTDKFQRLIQDSAKKLDELPDISQATFDCNDNVASQLKRTVFEANFIRWLGVTKNNVIYCESNEIIREITSVKTHRVSQNYSLGVVELSNSTHHELVLVKHVNDMFYTASIMPLEPSYFVPVDCDNCLEYKMSFDSDPFLTFGFDEYDGVNFVSEEVTLSSPYFNAKFELSGSYDFYKQYSTISWFVIILIASAFAGLVTYLYFRWQQHSNSAYRQILIGVKKEEFIPYYQPIVDSRSKEVVGCEVLMRWQRADGSLMPPNQFIPYAEANGLIIPMTKSLLVHLVNDIQLLGQHKPAMFFSVNIVPEHLESDELLTLVKSYIDDKVFGHHRLSLEITERMPIKDLEKARVMLDKFYAMGVDLKLDDAGTGYGGFSYVQKLGMSTLKIDKMFVDTIGQIDTFNAKTIDAIISFSEKSGLTTIAEGVEHQSQVDYLAQQGVYLIQGYVYSKPLPAEQFFN